MGLENIIPDSIFSQWCWYRLKFSGILHHAIRQTVTDVLEKHSASNFQCQATLKHWKLIIDTAFHHSRHEYSTEEILLSYLVFDFNCKSFGISKLYKHCLVNNFFLCYYDRQEGGKCNVVYHMPKAGHRVLLYWIR